MTLGASRDRECSRGLVSLPLMSLFCSSRRRHTRCLSDWSSDVCSSDLYALQFARDMEPRLAEKFVGMYVNHYTLDAGEVVPQAAQKLLDMGYEAGLISKRVEVEFVR